MPQKKKSLTAKKSTSRKTPAASKATTTSKREAARGLQVKRTTSAIDQIMRARPNIKWDDASAAGTASDLTASPDVRKKKGKTHLSAQDDQPDFEVVDNAGYFPTVRANWLGVDKDYKDVPQPTMGLPAIDLRDQAGNISLRMRRGFDEFVRLGEYGGAAGLWVGIDDQLPGRIVVRAGNSEGRILLDSADSSLSFRAADGTLRGRLFPTGTGAALQLFDFAGNPFAYLGDADGYGGLYLGGADRLPGRIALFKGNLGAQIILDADTGDIVLTNADCAEEFDVSQPDAKAGTVLVLDDKPGQLRPSEGAYDTRVAGVISGAGDYRPGIVLDRKGPQEGRRPVALVGKVFCQVEADSAPVRPGTLLTTSEIPGHAMAAIDRERAFGAVLGKALAPLETGSALLPVLVALQ